MFKDQDKFVELSPPENNPLRVTIPDMGSVIIKRPCFRDYRDFETDYASVLAAYLPLFKGVQFLDYSEFYRLSIKNQFIGQVRKAFYDRSFLDSFKGLLKRYGRLFILKGKIKAEKIDEQLSPSELSYVFLCMHFIILREKKNLSETALEILGKEIMLRSSIFSNTSSAGTGPRFGKLI
jgi:hypothetical protein